MSEKENTSDLEPEVQEPTSPGYDIIDDEAVISRSPSYRSIPNTGQVIPILDKKQDASKDGVQDVRNETPAPSGYCKLTGQSRTRKTSSSGVELNPFANVSVKIDSSGDRVRSRTAMPPHIDHTDTIGSGSLDDNLVESRHAEEDIVENVFSNLPLLPRVNCKEKIIICLDLSSEVNRVPFMSRDFTKYQPLDLIKRALNIFVKTKSTINPHHEYALVILQDTAVWMQDFTSDVDDFINVPLDLTSDTRDAELFDLTSLFDVIASKVDLPFVEDMLVLPPPYIVRTIFIYGRSNCVPEFLEGRESQKMLSSSPYFFFDVFYVHEPPSEENLCKEVYDVFLELDSNNTSYIHEVGRNTTHLHNKMAMLLGHPLQRPIQMQASHALNIPEI